MSQITVVASITLVPGREDRWVEAWEELGQRALNDPRSGCYAFRLFHDIVDQHHFVLTSEWESRSAFDSFMQSAGALWLARGLEYSSLPVKVMYLQRIAAHVSG
jgi:quinol monooxygenase YgiN